MKKIHLASGILLVSLALSRHIHAQDLDSTSGAFTFGASYIGDNVNNLKGGIKTGSAYLGMAHMTMDLDIHKIGLWSGGQFHVDAANTHGDTPSSDMLCDLQVASNIEAGNHTYIQELWYSQSFGRVEFIAGLQDMNAQLASSECGSLYLNSSFGILPTISHNIAAPIFPLTTLGLTAVWQVSDNITVVGAVHDGAPTDFENNPYNLNWQFRTGDGILSVGELHYTTSLFKLPGVYKMGVFSHNHLVERSQNDNFPDSLNTNTSGFYAYIDQTLWQHDERKLGTFMQIGYSPSSSCITDRYMGFGLNFTGLFSSQASDVLGVAVAREHFQGSNKCETAVELTYQYQFTENIFIQPDLQYIIHPSGAEYQIPDCLAAILRFGINF